MAWHRPGDKLLSEPMMVSLPTYICVTRPKKKYIYVYILSVPETSMISIELSFFYLIHCNKNNVRCLWKVTVSIESILGQKINFAGITEITHTSFEQTVELSQALNVYLIILLMKWCHGMEPLSYYRPNPLATRRNLQNSNSPISL